MKYAPSVLVAAAALTMAAPAQALRSHPVARPTLRRIDHCFYAPAPAAWAPFWPRRSPHPVHTGFNDMHGRGPMYAHWAVDVQTNIARAKVYAMTAGVIGDVVGGSDAHFQIGPFFYYHAISRFAAGTHVARGQWVGRLKPSVDHVHLAETEPGCGLLDARRPTGPLRDPMNTEHPTVENLRAYAANRSAYRIFPAWPSPGPLNPSLARRPARRRRPARPDLRHACAKNRRPPATATDGRRCAELAGAADEKMATLRARHHRLRRVAMDLADACLLRRDGAGQHPHPQLLQEPSTAVREPLHPAHRRQGPRHPPLPRPLVPLLRQRPHHPQPPHHQMLARTDPEPPPPLARSRRPWRASISRARTRAPAPSPHSKLRISSERAMRRFALSIYSPLPVLNGFWGLHEVGHAPTITIVPRFVAGATIEA